MELIPRVYTSISENNLIMAEELKLGVHNLNTKKKLELVASLESVLSIINRLYVKIPNYMQVSNFLKKYFDP